MLSYLVDADALSLFAVITHLEQNAKPWENVAVAIYFVQEVNRDLPAHASHLTKIEAPHYRTLGHKKQDNRKRSQPSYDDLFENTNRIINLDAIPDTQEEARNYFEKYYSRDTISINKAGRYVQVPNDGIYTYMYEISERIEWVKDTKGERYMEFFLI